MHRAHKAWVSCLAVGVALASTKALAVQDASAAQPATVPDRLKTLREAIAAMRGNDALTTSDQTVIREWLQAELDLYPEPPADSPDPMTAIGAGVKGFHAEIQRQISGGKPAFLAQVAMQATSLAAEAFPKPDLSVLDGMALSKLLLDFKRIETVPALKAGLTSKYPFVRYFSAIGLRELQAEIVAGNQLADVAAALRAAGVKEDVRDVRGAIYQALSVPNQAGAVFDAWLAILAARADAARTSGGLPGKDSTLPLIYFISEAPKLTAQQSEAIVRPLAVLLRTWIEAYSAAGALTYEDEISAESALYKAEELLAALTRTPGGIRKALEEKDAGGKDRLIAAAQAWYGAPDKPGVLSSDPWKVDLGAP